MFKAVWTKNTCPPDAVRIRTEVFVDEQGFSEEFDDIDGISHHLVLYDKGGLAVATGRAYSEHAGVYHLGRIAVARDMRKSGVGAFLMAALEQKARELGASRAELGAQMQAAGFYEKCGYVRFGEIFDDQGCPHVNMFKEL